MKAGTVDIKLKLKEKGKQSISFSGGVSGIAGSFIGASYTTNNFLGLGETLSLTAQVGNFQRNIQFGFTEPYLFDRPISTGFTIFVNKFDYNRRSQEGMLLDSKWRSIPRSKKTTPRTRRDSRCSRATRCGSFVHPAGVDVRISTTNIKPFSRPPRCCSKDGNSPASRDLRQLNGIRSSKVTPTISYNTVDNPQNPTHGKSFYYGRQPRGRAAAGQREHVSNTFTSPITAQYNKRRNIVRMQFHSAVISGYGGKNIPPYSRYYLGGENDVRGFEFYTISPFVQIPFATTTTLEYSDPHRINSLGNPTEVALTVPRVASIPDAARRRLPKRVEPGIPYPIAGPVTLTSSTTWASTAFSGRLSWH